MAVPTAAAVAASAATSATGDPVGGQGADAGTEGDESGNTYVVTHGDPATDGSDKTGVEVHGAGDNPHTDV